MHETWLVISLDLVATTKFLLKVKFSFTHELPSEELQTELNKMSASELAAIVNPGVAPRLHIIPR